MKEKKIIFKSSKNALPKIILENNPLIRQKSELVSFPLTSEDHNTIQKMVNYVDWSMDEKKRLRYHLKAALGISAIQIGVPKKIIYFNFINDDNKPLRRLLINPKIISHNIKKICVKNGEGCLSVERTDFVNQPIYRYQKIKIKAFDYFANCEIIEMYEGLAAIICQHELDHLNGILFIDYFLPK